MEMEIHITDVTEEAKALREAVEVLEDQLELAEDSRSFWRERSQQNVRDWMAQRDECSRLAAQVSEQGMTIEWLRDYNGVLREIAQEQAEQADAALQAVEILEENIEHLEQRNANQYDIIVGLRDDKEFYAQLWHEAEADLTKAIGIACEAEAQTEDYRTRLAGANEDYMKLQSAASFRLDVIKRLRERIKTYRLTLEEIAKARVDGGLAAHVLSSQINDGGADY